MLGELDEKEALVLKLRFGLDDDQPRTLQEIGDQLRLTRERIRQIEQKAMRKLSPVPQAPAAERIPELMPDRRAVSRCGRTRAGSVDAAPRARRRSAAAALLPLHAARLAAPPANGPASRSATRTARFGELRVSRRFPPRRAEDRAEDRRELSQSRTSGCCSSALPAWAKRISRSALLARARSRRRESRACSTISGTSSATSRAPSLPDSALSESDILAPVFESKRPGPGRARARSGPSAWVEETIFYIINHRYNQKKLTIFTSNFLDAADEEDTAPADVQEDRR